MATDFVLTRENSFLDLIRTSIPEDKPIWTENIAWDMHDFKAGISLYGHLGRMQPDRSLWEGLSLIYMPDGGMLVNRSLGASLDQARNREYHYRPVIPGKLWQYMFEGVAQRVDPEELRTRPVADEPFERVSYNLTFEAVMPVFNMHNTQKGTEHMHLEQGGRVFGSFTVGDKLYPVDCTGYRDHSVSERTFTTLDTETWAHCTFASGKVFSMLEVSRGDNKIAKGQVYKEGKVEVIEPLDFPELTSSNGNPHQGNIRLRRGSGEVENIQWQTTNQFIPFNLLQPVGLRPGIDLSLKEGMAAIQCPAIFTWEGETGYGWMERTRPVAQLES